MKDLFFILDQGTTQHKLVVFGQYGAPCDILEKPSPMATHHNDGFSFDTQELTRVSDELIAAAMDKYAGRFFAFGFANQGETVLAWDAKTGEPLSRAVSWQCLGAEDVLSEKRADFAAIQKLSGLVPNPYFSAAKLEKLLRVNDPVRRAAQAGSLLLGTLDTWMIWKWTRGKSFVTDPTTACRTQLYGTFQGDWSRELTRLFNIRREFLPDVLGNDQFEIVCDSGPFAGRGLPLLSSFCDQPAALIGHGGLAGDCLKVTLGTGAFIDLACSNLEAVPERLLTSVLHADKDKTTHYLEGGVLSFASAIEQCCRDHSTKLEEALPLLMQDHDVCILPALTGLGAPHFRSDIRTVVKGLKARHDGKNMLAAMLRGLCFRIVEILNVMAPCYHLPDVLRVDGGMSQINSLMQFLADSCEKKIAVSDRPHVTAEGIARMILIKTGRATKTTPITTGEKTFQPRDPTVARHYREWKEFVNGILL